jgi:type II secretory pathway pseudopilin PulG
MRTSSAPMPIERRPWGRRLLPAPTVAADARADAFTLVELLVVMTFLALLIAMAQVNLFGTLRRSTFKAQVQDFVSTMQMAVAKAAESSRRFEVIVELPAQTYLLRELTGSNLEAEPLEEEIIAQGEFRGNCRCSYVQFDDGTHTNADRAKFRAGHMGWQYGGKVVFLDESEQPYAVIVNRVTPIVQLLEGDPLVMTPKARETVPFL